MTAGLLCSARNKQKIAMKVKKNPNNTKLLKYYINYKNNFTNILRLTKIKFFKTKFKNVILSPKLTWKLIKEITNTEVNSWKEIKSILINNRVINALDKPHAVSSFFNIFFTEIGKNTLENNTNFKNNELKDNISDLSFDDIFSSTITESEVSKIIKNLKDETAAGIDKVTVKLIKYIEAIIIGPLTYLYNLSIEKCTFPENLKIAIVTPLYKGGDHKYVN